MASAKQKILKNFCKHLLPFFPKRKYRPLLGTGNSIGITTLLCHRDVTMFIYGLNSFFYHLGYQLSIFIIDDGSLTNADKKILTHHFHACIESTTTADLKMKKLLKNRPSILKNRFSNTNGKYKLKLDAILLHPFKKFILLDADVLFFSQPLHIKDWMEGKENIYCYPSYPEWLFLTSNSLEFSLRAIIYKHLKVNITKGFNSGILLFPERIDKDINKINLIFKFFDESSLLNFDGLDDLSLAILFGKKNNTYLLPESFYRIVFLGSDLDAFREPSREPIAIHFGWQTKVKFFEHAIRETFKSHFFRKS